MLYMSILSASEELVTDKINILSWWVPGLSSCFNLFSCGNCIEDKNSWVLCYNVNGFPTNTKIKFLKGGGGKKPKNITNKSTTRRRPTRMKHSGASCTAGPPHNLSIFMGLNYKMPGGPIMKLLPCTHLLPIIFKLYSNFQYLSLPFFCFSDSTS